MKRRDASLFFTLVLALSLALSPISAFADELDTPVHEDPIDEIQYDDGYSQKAFQLPFSGPGNTGTVSGTLSFISTIDYSICWTEGFDSAILDVYYNPFTVYIGLNSPTPTALYPRYKAGNTAYAEFTADINTEYALRFRVGIRCDEYGDIVHFASIQEVYHK